MRFSSLSLLAACAVVPVSIAQASPSVVVNDDTLVRAYYLNAPSTGYGTNGWLDVLGDAVFNTKRVEISYSGDDVAFRIFTNYTYPNPSGLGLFPTADVAFDLDLDGAYELGFATTSHGGIAAGKLYSVPTNGWTTSLDLFGTNGSYVVAGRYDDCRVNPASCVDTATDVPVVKIKDGATVLGTYGFTQSVNGDGTSTYVDAFTLTGVNAKLSDGSRPWDSFAFLFGTAWCGNDTIQGVVFGGPDEQQELPVPPALGLFAGALGLLGVPLRRRA